MDNTNQSKDLIKNITNDDHLVVTENNLDQDKDTEMDWIAVDFTENDLEEYRKQNYLSHESDVDDNSPDEMLPSRWEVIKERAHKIARFAIVAPPMLALSAIVLPVIVPVYIGGLLFGFLLDDPDSTLSKWVSA